MTGRGILTFFQEILFPHFCVACGSDGSWWCDSCRQKEKISLHFSCPTCGSVLKDEGLSQHRCPGNLDAIITIFPYVPRHPAATLIRAFKYHQGRSLVTLWQDVLTKVSFLFVKQKEFTIIPVPLHESRLRSRGYNQAELIARLVAERASVPLDSSSLRRVRPTAQQAKLKIMNERQQNVSGAFRWVAPAAPKRVFLVDDVFTTGATMQECAGSIKAAGAEEVIGFALAHG